MEAIEHPLLFRIPNFWPVSWFSPGAFVPDYIALSWLVMLLLAVLSLLATRHLRPVPRGMQNFMEVAVEEIGNFLESVIGPKGRKYLWLMGAIALFILCGNLLGIIPGLGTPTSNWNTTLALALTIFIAYNVIGMMEHGVWPYVKHFCGPVPALAPIMFPIELIGHMARPLSLSIRLFGNMFGEHTVTAILLSLWALVIPYLIYLGLVMWLGLFVAVVQTFVFVMLSCVYIAGALEGGHEEDHGHGGGPQPRDGGSAAGGRSHA
jgi:F-type H+-transporting ATPase subunit a